MPADLHEEGASVAFYDARYSGHYMEEWSAEAKDRIVETVHALNPGPSGEALDFGCGNGVMTELLRVSLGPGWRVSGCDFSSVAVDNARHLYPECEFIVLNELDKTGRQFDLLFTHHVLEHVYDLSKTAREIASLAKPAAAMIHILPCGNEGSLEHRVASLRTDGIDRSRGNRFFFEDEGHLRRLHSTELASLFAGEGFRLERAFFRNQYFGALDWMTQSGPGVIRKLADRSKATGPDARKELGRLRRRLLLWWLLRFPASFAETRLRRQKKSTLDTLLLLPGIMLYPFSKPVDLYLRRRAVAEWNALKSEPNGSEMFVLLRRG